MSAEACGQPLQAAVARINLDAIDLDVVDLDGVDWDALSRGHAQTFKTVRPSPPIWPS
jgi:hypothetical protein